MFTFVERVELNLRCLVMRGPLPEEVEEARREMKKDQPVQPAPGWLIRSYLAGCRLEAQFERR